MSPNQGLIFSGNGVSPARVTDLVPEIRQHLPARPVRQDSNPEPLRQEPASEPVRRPPHRPEGDDVTL